MAIDIIGNQQDNDKKEQPGGVSAPPAAGIAPAQPTGAVGGSGQGQQAKATGRTGSGFTNLQNVLNANKQNRMGAAVQGGIQGKVQNVGQGLNQAQSTFQQGLQQNSLDTEQNRTDRENIINKVMNYQSPDTVQSFGIREGQSAPVNTVGQGPLVSDQDVQKFSQFRAGQYTGPTGLQGTQNLREQAQEAEQLGKNINTGGGRQQLLQQFVGGQNPSYTKGLQTLDTMLLGLTGGKNLQEAKRGTIGLSNNVNRADQAAIGAARTEQAKAEQFGKDTRDRLGSVDLADPTKGTGLLGDLYSGLSTELQDKEIKAQEEFKALQDAIQNKSLTAEQAQKYLTPLLIGQGGQLTGDTSLFGITPEMLQSAYNKQQYNLEDVTDSTELNKVRALQALAGRDDIKIDPTKMGTMKDNVVIDQSQFGDYQKRQAEYQQQVNPLLKFVSQAQMRQQTVNDVLDTLDKTTGNYNQRIQTIDALLADPRLNFVPDLKQELAGERARLEKWLSVPEQTRNNSLFGSNLYNPGSLIGRDSIVHDDYSRYAGDFANQGRPTYQRYADLQNQIYNRANEELNKVKQKYSAQGTIQDLLRQEDRDKFQSTSDLVKQSPQDFTTQEFAEAMTKYLPGEFGAVAGREKDLGEMLLGSAGGLYRGIGSMWQDALGGYTDWLGNARDQLFSDKNLKTDIKAGDKKVEDFLNSISPYQYEYKNSKYGEGKHLGIMAQDLENTEEGRSAVENTPEGKQVRFGKLAGMMMASQANIHKRLKELEGKKK